MEPKPIPPELVTRLSCQMEPYQLEEFLRACEAVRLAGNGYGTVTVTFVPGGVTQIDGQFTRKPRRDQTGLLR